ncbi:MAG TPA: VOC family protein [Pseudonocardiaceae bacterium]|nr:VOC family protein [Pseudonocardiaceae bacterium]
MVSRFTELAVDCHDPERLATFWCAVLGFEVIDRNQEIVEIASWEPTPEQVRKQQMPPTILFIRVPEDKVVKNRVHLDVSPIDRTSAEEVRRLLDLGARPADVGQGEQNWTVLADPEGNEFCVLRSLAD